MRTHTVQQGESPASIATIYAGCPKCAKDLVEANAEKLTHRYPNGFVSFQHLRAGEILNLPDKWFSKEFDLLPPSYFAGLPSADGGFLGAPEPFLVNLLDGHRYRTTTTYNVPTDQFVAANNAAITAWATELQSALPSSSRLTQVDKANTDDHTVVSVYDYAGPPISLAMSQPPAGMTVVQKDLGPSSGGAGADSGLSTGAKVAIGAGALIIAGIAVWAATK
jgi:hypothetical protein